MQFDLGSNCASNFKIEEILFYKSSVRKFQTNFLKHPCMDTRRKTFAGIH